MSSRLLSFRGKRFSIALLLAGVSHFWLPATSKLVAPGGWLSVFSALLIYFGTFVAICLLLSAISGRTIRGLLSVGEEFENLVARSAIYLVAIVLVLAALLFSTGFTYYQFERAGEIDMSSAP